MLTIKSLPTRSMTANLAKRLFFTAFNYARAVNDGIEFKLKYQNGGFRAYGNLAWSRQLGTQIVSNQYLFDPDEFAYIATHWIYADHSQTLTGSAGISYAWGDTRSRPT